MYEVLDNDTKNLKFWRMDIILFISFQMLQR